MKPVILAISTTLILLPAMTRVSRYVEQQETAFSQYVDKNDKRLPCLQRLGAMHGCAYRPMRHRKRAEYYFH